MDGKERVRRIPFSGLQQRATPPDASSASRHWVASILALAGVARLARSLRISALRSRLGQRQNRQQRASLQYFNSLLNRFSPARNRVINP